MRKIHFFWFFFFLCVSCSTHDYVNEYEKEEVRDSVNSGETYDTIQITANDSIASEVEDTVNVYEEEEVRDSINPNETCDTIQNTANDSIASEVEDTVSTIIPSVEDEKNSVRTFSVLGNSISTYTGYIPNGYDNYYTPSRLSVEDTWWMLLSKNEEYELASNASWSGSTVINSGRKSANSYFTAEGRLNALSVNGIPDMIIVLGGTNDWGTSAGYLGDYPIEENYDLKTFRGAYSYLVVRLKDLYPNTSIICCSILPRKQSRIQKNNYGVTQQEIDESIAYIANAYSVIFIDLSKCGLEKDINGFTLDGLHPNKAGMKVVADYLYEKLKSLGF